MDERWWRKTKQVRHICIFDVPSSDACPGRGDIEMGLLSESDALREDIITLHRDAEVDYDADPPEVRAKGEWYRMDYIYGPETPEEEYSLRLRMIETMQETIRFLRSDMPQLMGKITAYSQRSEGSQTE